MQFKKEGESLVYLCFNNYPLQASHHPKALHVKTAYGAAKVAELAASCYHSPEASIRESFKEGNS